VEDIMFKKRSNFIVRFISKLLVNKTERLIKKGMEDEELIRLKGEMNDALNDLQSSLKDYNEKYGERY